MSTYTIKYFLFILIVFSSCKQENQPLTTAPQWSGLHSGQVPENIRKRELSKKNLISNPSFEKGKHYMADTLKLSFSLPGWKKVGENVFWTDIEDELTFLHDEASKGTHAIKIVKDVCNETDNQGEGIISDYIKVIPGNYMLRLDLRLKNIVSNMDRFGTGVFDAVNISLFYYDKNKVLIKSKAYHPEYDREINQAFKGFNFAGNENISEFGWAEIVARAGNFPYEEGNIPDDTRYVKIFAGLKGTGEMYIDFVRFEYTTKNFTYLEQLQPYFDTILDKSAYLIPGPRKSESYRPLETFIINEKEEKTPPLFILPKSANSHERVLFNNLKMALQEKGLISAKSENYTYRYRRIDSESYPFVISFGLNDLSSQFSDRLPVQELEGKKQAYYIKDLSNGDNLIFIDYSDVEGLGHAINTFTQLIDENNEIYHHYNISDYPDYTERTAIIPYFINDNYTEYSEWLNLLREFGFNKFIAKIASQNLSTAQIDELTKTWLSHFKNIQDSYHYVKKGVFLETVKLIETQNSLEEGKVFGDLELEEALAKDAAALAGLVNRIDRIKPDFWIFSDRFLREIQIRNMRNTLSMDNYSYFIDGERIFWKSLSSELKISATTPKYLHPFFLSNSDQKNNELVSRLYFDNIDDLGMNFTKTLWTGAVEFPEFIDPSDIYNYSGNSVSLLSMHSNMRKESCLTGSYYSLYAGRALTGSLFDGFNTKMIGITPEMLNYECLFDLENFTELNLIRLLSSLDYLWNSSAYNPTFSSWKVLVKLYGKETAQSLVLFNDAYYRLNSTIIDLDKLGFNQRISKNGEYLISELNKYWDKITTDLASHTSLLNDLSDLKHSLISRYYQSARISSRETTVE